MTYSAFKNKWLGKRIDADKLYGYQCVDLVKQYMLETKKVPNGAYGNAIDYWYRTHTNVRKHYDRVATKTPRQGDIVILSGVGGNPYGHIGIASGKNTVVTAQILEQNGSTGNGSGVGGDAIRLRHIPKWRIVGVLRPKSVPATKPVAKPKYNMPKVGQKIQLIPKQKRGTFKAGTTKVAGTINVTNNTFIYLVRGYDKKYPNRILINSASAGGNGVALALYYTNGKSIGGWKIIK